MKMSDLVVEHERMIAASQDKSKTISIWDIHRNLINAFNIARRVCSKKPGLVKIAVLRGDGQARMNLMTRGYLVKTVYLGGLDSDGLFDLLSYKELCFTARLADGFVFIDADINGHAHTFEVQSVTNRR